MFLLFLCYFKNTVFEINYFCCCWFFIAEQVKISIFFKLKAIIEKSVLRKL